MPRLSAVGISGLQAGEDVNQEDVRRREEEARIQNENLEKLAGIREQYPDIAQERVIIFANPPNPP